jgi:hypothetical protein
MNVRAGTAVALLLWTLACGGEHSKTTKSNAVRPIPPTRTISLRAQQLRDPDQASDKTALTLSSAAADEGPEGPTGFDVMRDGGFLITDPLRSRLVSYDSQGTFRWELPIQYRAETVRILDTGDMETFNLIDSKRYLHARDAQGNFGPPQAAPSGQVTAAQADAGVSRLLNAAHGSISELPGSGQAGSPIEVFFEAAGRRLVSLRRLGKDAQGNSYVALESASASGTIDVQTVIRKYAPDGRQIGEIQGVLSDSIVHPVEEFRERGGVIYQMAPYATEVRIQVWDTNGVR